MNRHLTMRTANPALQSDTFKKSMTGSVGSSESCPWATQEETAS